MCGGPIYFGKIHDEKELGRSVELTTTLSEMHLEYGSLWEDKVQNEK